MTSCHIVFLPGLFARGWIWNTVAKECRKQGHTITVLEPSIPEIFGGELANARTILQDCLYRKSGTGPVVLVGNSMSGLIALDFASYYPEAIDGLIMSGSPGLVELNAGVSINSLRKGCMATAQSLGERVFYDIEKVPQKGVEDIQKICSEPEYVKAMIKWLNISRKYNIEEALERVECPVQLIWGDHDLITPGEAWSDFAQKHAAMTYSEVPLCGHSPMLEKPFEFMTLMSFYLNSLHQPLTQTA